MVQDAEALVTPLPGQAFIGVLISTLHAVKYSVCVIQYQWNFYRNKPDCQIQKLNRTLLARAASGIKIRVLLNKEGRESHLTAINLSAAGVLRDAGIEVKFARSFPTTHAKLWVFDDDAVIVGSHNLSNRSVTVNNECSILVKSRPTAMEFKRYFDEIWKISG